MRRDVLCFRAAQYMLGQGTEHGTQGHKALPTFKGMKEVRPYIGTAA